MVLMSRKYTDKEVLENPVILLGYGQSEEMKPFTTVQIVSFKMVYNVAIRIYLWWI